MQTSIDFTINTPPSAEFCRIDVIGIIINEGILARSGDVTLKVALV